PRGRPGAGAGLPGAGERPRGPRRGALHRHGHASRPPAVHLARVPPIAGTGLVAGAGCGPARLRAAVILGAPHRLISRSWARGGVRYSSPGGRSPRVADAESTVIGHDLAHMPSSCRMTV